MENVIINDMEKRRKIRVNLTVDKLLMDALDDYKKKHGIQMLSPMVNSMLWKWLEQENKPLEVTQK